MAIRSFVREDLFGPKTLCAAPVVAATDELPEWIQCTPKGEYKGHWSGYEFNLGDFELDSIVANFAVDGIHLVVDFDHQTLRGEWNGKPAPAMAWVDALEKREDGIWGHVKEWTVQGGGFVRAKEYKYLSPVLCWMKHDRKTNQPRGAWIHSLALTNRPFFAGDLEPVAAAQPVAEDGLAVELGTRVLQKLWPAGTPAPTATAEALASLDKVLAHEGYIKLEDHLRQVSAAAKEGQAQANAETQLRDLVDAAVRSGHVPPGSREAFEQLARLNPTAAQELLKGAPKVPITPLPKPANNPAQGLSPIEQQVCAQAGITPEQFIKAKETQQ